MLRKSDFSFKFFQLVLYVLIFQLDYKICNASNSCSKTAYNNSRPIVLTKTGAIAGKFINVLNKDLATFQGIPFAKPPVRNLRFKKPEPIDYWSGVLLAEKMSPACMQYPLKSSAWIPFDLTKSEDCLYLNVWTPSNFQTSSKKAVLVFIHSGAFSLGSATQTVHDGSVIAALGNVIFVSMNYRLGVFGYFNSGTTDSPGNVALLDVYMALKWIKENISHFGGDPNKITLNGQSSGAIFVGLFLVSPLTSGLFQAAILQSNSPFNAYIYTEDAAASINRSNHFAELIGCSNETVNLKNNPTAVVDCMKSQNPFQLSRMEGIISSKILAYFRPYSGPNCDDCNLILPVDLVKSVRKPIQVPLIIGSVDTEAARPTLNLPYPDLFPFDSEPRVDKHKIEQLTDEIFSTIPAAVKKIKQFYFYDINKNDTAALVEAFVNAISDGKFNCHCLFFSEIVDKVFFYWFTHRSAKNPMAKWVGVTHAGDFVYSLGRPLVEIDKYTDEDRSFSAGLIKRFTSFAKHHFPISEPKWSKFRASNPQAYLMDHKKYGMIPYPRREACEFWRPVLKLGR